MLKKLREQSKLTQKELAFLSKVSIKTISRIENGEENIQYNTIKKLADFFEVDEKVIMNNNKRDG